MADGGNICRRTGIKFGCGQLDHLKNIRDKFQKNLKNGLGGDAVTRLLQCYIKGKSRFLRWPSGSHTSQRTGIFLRRHI